MTVRYKQFIEEGSLPHGERLIGLKVLMVDDELLAQTVTGRAVRAATRYRNGSATPAFDLRFA